MIDDLDAIAMELCQRAGKAWNKRGARLWRKRAAALQVLADRSRSRQDALAEAGRIMRGGR